MIDLRSDTVTQPSPEMLSAMCAAPLGDDVLGDDPSVLALEEHIAGIIGTETAVFVPSGTMANQIAIWLQTSRGSAIAVEQDSHIYHYEASSPALLSSVRMKPISGNRGIMSPQALSAAFPPDDPHFSPIELVCVEDTANRGGGTVYPVQTLRDIQEIGRKQHTALHLDGARFFNAQVASGIEASERAKGFDTISICFSKGLGAPVGSALCMPRSMRRDAIRIRKMLGGGMRQSGILAAAAQFALHNNIRKLEHDHFHARLMALELANMGFSVQSPQSNMIYFEHPQAGALVEKSKEEGVLFLAVGPTTIRLVTHLGVKEEEIKLAIARIQKVQHQLHPEKKDLSGNN